MLIHEPEAVTNPASAQATAAKTASCIPSRGDAGPFSGMLQAVLAFTLLLHQALSIQLQIVNTYASSVVLTVSGQANVTVGPSSTESVALPTIASCKVSAVSFLTTLVWKLS